jgi:hypothetical protein
LAFISCLVAATLGLQAGPPFFTDDPEPVEPDHWEFYLFGQGTKAAGFNSISAPAIEVNYGVAKNVQLHVVAPVANFSARDAGWSSGFGDTEIGIKYRFLEETDSQPQLAFFPMAEVATGNSSRGLGNGRTWYRLPIWAQKSWGPWATYGGGGWAANSAPGQRNYSFAGWLIQRDLGEKLTLGAELFRQGASTSTGEGSTIANFGGTFKFTKNVNLLFSVGHTLSGPPSTVWYFGLYWTGAAHNGVIK